MRRVWQWLAIGCTVVAPLALTPSSIAAGTAKGGETMSIVFGVNATSSEGSLEARGAVSGPGTSLGGGPLSSTTGVLQSSRPGITFTKHGLTTSETYSFTVSGGHEVQGSRTKVLTLGVQLSHSTDPNCPATGGGKQGAHGVLTIVEDFSGSSPVTRATLNLPCAGVHEEWQGESASGGLDVALRGAPKSTTTSTQGSASAGTFVLDPAKTQVTDAQDGALTINNSGTSGTADWNHTGQYGGAGNAGDWVVKFSWKAPSTLVPGQFEAITIGIDVISENPPQQNTYQINALAPDFAQAISVTYPQQKSLSKTFTVPLHADYGGGGIKELTISIGFVSSGVVFHYEYKK